ncbi:MAG TPA: YdcF family protein [Nitrospira sp.]|nr:YdcF family protein [Nitrospira sp.]
MELHPFLFALYKLAKYAIYPLSWVVFLVALTACMLWLPPSPTRIRLARISGSLSLVVLLFISTPIVSEPLIASLESWYPANPPLPSHPYDAIVVLGGGILDRGTLRQTAALSSQSRERTVCGVDLYQQGYASKLILTGGDAQIFGRGPIEASQMRQWAERLGVPPADIMMEEESRTTYENATGTKKLLREGSIVLVSSAVHLPRAVALFEKQGFTVTPAPCDFAAKHRLPDLWRDLNPLYFLPNDTALQHTRQAVDELAGMVVYRLAGKL